jgi:hypothetical protein
MADYLISQSPRRPWLVVKRMISDVLEDGAIPNLEMYNIAMQIARRGKRYDRVWNLYEIFQSSVSLFSPAVQTSSQLTLIPSNDQVIPDSRTFSMMFTALDDVRPRHAHYNHPSKPSPADVFRLFMDVHLHFLLQHSSLHPQPPSRFPSPVLTIGTLNLALRYFMNSEQYACALITLEMFLSINSGTNIIPNERTKWIVDVACLRRCVNELRGRLEGGFVKFPSSAMPGSVGSLTWTEHLTGMRIDDVSLHEHDKNQSPTTIKEEWSKLRHTRAFKERAGLLIRMSRALERSVESKPAYLPPSHVVESYLEESSHQTENTDHVARIIKETLKFTEKDTKHTATVIISKSTSSLPRAVFTPSKPPSIRTLLEIVGRCALAAEGVSRHADDAVRQETLARVVHTAKEKILSEQFRAWQKEQQATCTPARKHEYGETSNLEMPLLAADGRSPTWS